MTISGAFDELMNIRGGAEKPGVRFSGKDPVYSSHYRIAETGAAVLGAVGVAVSDIWELKPVDANQFPSTLVTPQPHSTASRTSNGVRTTVPLWSWVTRLKPTRRTP